MRLIRFRAKFFLYGTSIYSRECVLIMPNVRVCCSSYIQVKSCVRRSEIMLIVSWNDYVTGHNLN